MILVTGCSGYIGSQLCYILKKEKINFIGIDNLEYSNKKNIIKNYFYKIDISSSKVKNLINKYKINSVIHCAAFSYVNDGEDNKKKYHNNNILKTKKFINICKKNLIKNFIFLSSSNVYKDGKSIFNEKDLKNPKNLYGKNKLEIENYLKKIKFNNLIILRLFNIVGLIKKFYIFKLKKINYQRLFFKMLDNDNLLKLRYFKIKKKKFFPKRDFLDINVLVDLILLILNKLESRKINKTFNVGSGKTISIYTISKLFKKYKKKLVFDKPSLITKKELMFTKAKITNVKKYFKWHPKRKIYHSILTTLKYGKI
jgi:UDP-glucose 4-epimerase